MALITDYLVQGGQMLLILLLAPLLTGWVRAIKARLLTLGDQRVGKDGVIVIKAQTFRSLDKNRA